MAEKKGAKSKRDNSESKKGPKVKKPGKKGPKVEKPGKKGSKVATRPVSEAGYPNLVLCAVDAVFIQRGSLAATGPVCSLVAFGGSAKWKPAPHSAKFTTADLVMRLDGVGVSQLVSEVFGSDSKALGCPDLSRAQVVVELCRGLADAGILTKADARAPENRDAVMTVARSTRGIGAAGAARLVALAQEFEFSGAPWLTAHFAELLGREVTASEADALLEREAAERAKSTRGVSVRDVAFDIWRSRAGYSSKFRCV